MRSKCRTSSKSPRRSRWSRSSRSCDLEEIEVPSPGRLTVTEELDLEEIEIPPSPRLPNLHLVPRHEEEVTTPLLEVTTPILAVVPPSSRPLPPLPPVPRLPTPVSFTASLPRSLPPLPRLPSISADLLPAVRPLPPLAPPPATEPPAELTRELAISEPPGPVAYEPRPSVRRWPAPSRQVVEAIAASLTVVFLVAAGASFALLLRESDRGQSSAEIDSSRTRRACGAQRHRGAGSAAASGRHPHHDAGRAANRGARERVDAVDGRRRSVRSGLHPVSQLGAKLQRSGRWKAPRRHAPHGSEGGTRQSPGPVRSSRARPGRAQRVRGSRQDAVGFRSFPGVSTVMRRAYLFLSLLALACGSENTKLDFGPGSTKSAGGTSAGVGGSASSPGGGGGGLGGVPNPIDAGEPPSEDAGPSCSCDESCEWNDDCCNDCWTGSGGSPSSGAGSCANACGGQSPDWSCYCDSDCTWYGDCCADFTNVCGGADSGAPGSGCSLSECNGAVPAHGPAGPCFCDPACAQYGDCCPNKAQVCGP